MTPLISPLPGAMAAMSDLEKKCSYSGTGKSRTGIQVLCHQWYLLPLPGHQGDHHQGDGKAKEEAQSIPNEEKPKEEGRIPEEEG